MAVEHVWGFLEVDEGLLERVEGAELAVATGGHVPRELVRAFLDVPEVALERGECVC